MAPLLPRPQLVDHAFDLSGGWPRSSRAEKLEGINIFGPEGLLSGFCYHSTFHPHLDLLLDRQAGAFWDEERCEFCVASTQDLIIERLLLCENRCIQVMLGLTYLPSDRRFSVLPDFFQFTPVALGDQRS